MPTHEVTNQTPPLEDYDLFATDPAEVAHKLEQFATRQPVFQLWWVTGAVIEALNVFAHAGCAIVLCVCGKAWLFGQPTRP